VIISRNYLSIKIILYSTFKSMDSALIKLKTCRRTFLNVIFKLILLFL